MSDNPSPVLSSTEEDIKQAIDRLRGLARLASKPIPRPECRLLPDHVAIVLDALQSREAQPVTLGMEQYTRGVVDGLRYAKQRPDMVDQYIADYIKARRATEVRLSENIDLSEILEPAPTEISREEQKT